MMRIRVGPIVLPGALCLGTLAGLGCAGPERAGIPGPVVSEKLARIGLEAVGEREARIPAPERGRYLPCRVIRGFQNPALEDHPAGYLIVGIEGEPPGDLRRVLRALESWSPGETLSLVVRRNPYLDAGPEWWEMAVRLRLPR